MRGVLINSSRWSSGKLPPPRSRRATLGRCVQTAGRGRSGGARIVLGALRAETFGTLVGWSGRDVTFASVEAHSRQTRAPRTRARSRTLGHGGRARRDGCERASPPRWGAASRGGGADRCALRFSPDLPTGSAWTALASRRATRIRAPTPERVSPPLAARHTRALEGRRPAVPTHHRRGRRELC